MVGAAGSYLAARTSGFSLALSPHATAGQVPAGDVSRTHVTALGRLEPESEVIDVSGPAGTRVHTLEVSEGAEVAQGDILARMESFPRRLAETRRAEARLREARAIRQAETRNGEAEIRQAGLELERINTLSPFEIEAQESTVRRLRADFGNATRNLGRLETLNEKDRVSVQEVDEQRMVVLRLREQVAGAGLKLARLKAKREIDLLEVRTRLESTEARLHRARLATHVESLATELELARAELDRTIIRAPIDGTILKVLTHPGERIANAPIVKMGSTAQMYAVAEVYETDARFVQPSQRARMTSPALPEALEGTVERVSRLIFKNDVLDVDPAARVDARVVEVRIRLDDSSMASQFNHLQVRVRIELDPRSGHRPLALPGRET